jgi:hypothetical protein
MSDKPSLSIELQSDQRIPHSPRSKICPLGKSLFNKATIKQQVSLSIFQSLT